MEEVDLSRSGNLIERAVFAIAMAGTAALGLLVTASIAARWIGGVSIPDSVLLVRELMVPVIILPLAIVTATRGHIAVTIFTRNLSARPQHILAIVGHLVGFLFVGMLAWAGWLLFEDAVMSGEFHDGDLNLPKWMARAVYVTGFALVVVRLGTLFVRDLLCCPDSGPDSGPDSDLAG